MPAADSKDRPRGNPEELGCFSDAQAPLLHFLKKLGTFLLPQLA